MGKVGCLFFFGGILIALIGVAAPLALPLARQQHPLRM